MTNIEHLKNGYRDFFRHYFDGSNKIYSTLKETQKPCALVIACSDSRVDPAILTQAHPGDIFVVRNVANLVPAFNTDDNAHCEIGAALEYAVNHLKVPNILVLGHRHCGGINALVNSTGSDESDFIGKWIALAEPVRAQAEMLSKQGDTEPVQHICEKQSIVHSLTNLLSYPWIFDKLKKGELNIHGWYFDFTNGSLYNFNADTQSFEPILVD